MEATVSARAGVVHAHITAALRNGCNRIVSSVQGDTQMKQIWIFIVVAALAVSLYAQVSARESYQKLKDENEELHDQLSEIHSEVEDAQSELETLKSDVDDVQSAASDCNDCDDVESAASDLDTPIQSLDSNLDTIESKSQE
jgi:uncharacterized protein YlxW (UPF0749 family)